MRSEYEANIEEYQLTVSQCERKQLADMESVLKTKQAVLLARSVPICTCMLGPLWLLDGPTALDLSEFRKPEAADALSHGLDTGCLDLISQPASIQVTDFGHITCFTQKRPGNLCIHWEMKVSGT